MIRGIVFDFDGLILDTESPEYQTWRDVFEENGCRLAPETWAHHIGTGATSAIYNPYDDLEQQLGRACERDTLRAQLRARRIEIILAQPVLPGVEDYIADAKRLGLRVGLASSSDREWVVGHLTRLGLHAHFDAMKTLEDVERAKPDPALYVAALDALGLRPDEAIALEDSLNGVRAAKAAGLFTVAVPNPITRLLDFAEADLRLDALSDLPLEMLLKEAEARNHAR